MSTALLAAVSFGAHAAGASDAAPGSQARYEQERARCLAGKSGQVLEACLREAGAVKQQGASQMTDGGAKMGQDEKKRCDALAGAERRDCLARVDGAANSSASGSVKGGGILRETVTTTTTTTTTPAASAPR